MKLHANSSTIIRPDVDYLAVDGGGLTAIITARLLTVWRSLDGCRRVQTRSFLREAGETKEVLLEGDWVAETAVEALRICISRPVCWTSIRGMGQ